MGTRLRLILSRSIADVTVSGSDMDLCKFLSHGLCFLMSRNLASFSHIPAHYQAYILHQDLCPYHMLVPSAVESSICIFCHRNVLFTCLEDSSYCIPL